MSNFQTGRARGGRARGGRARGGRAPIGWIVVLFLVAIAVGFLLVNVLRSPRSGAPSAAGLASASAALEPSPGESSSAGGSPLSSASAASNPTPKPTPKPTPRPTPRPTATPSTRPAIASYQIQTTADCGGNTMVVQIQITWVVRRATGVTISIDGPGIYKRYPGATGLATVPFACGVGDTKHTYTLTTTGGSGPAAHWTKTVKRTG